MGNPNDLAMNMVTFLPLAVDDRDHARPAAAARRRGDVIAVLMIATILFTKSRGRAPRPRRGRWSSS